MNMHCNHCCNWLYSCLYGLDTLKFFTCVCGWCLTLLEILEIFWKFAKSPGNFLTEFVCSFREYTDSYSTVTVPVSDGWMTL